MPVEVAWEQLTVPGDAQDDADPGSFETSIVEPLAVGSKDVTKDRIGRDVLRRKLNSIRIR